jgi:hypothetical protein
MLVRLGTRARKVDAVAVHAYLPTVSAVVQMLRTTRALLAASGLSQVPIEITEVGWHARNVQAQNYRELACGLPAMGLGVTRFIPHTWVDSPPDFGIAQANGTLKATGRAYIAAVRGHCPRKLDLSAPPTVAGGGSTPDLLEKLLGGRRAVRTHLRRQPARSRHPGADAHR